MSVNNSQITNGNENGPFGSNPFVGPRPFEREDSNRFFGRRREGRRLRNNVLSNSVVLFYAQSGCGKTSLLNAYLLPELEEEDFYVLPIARVRRALPKGFDPNRLENIYACNASHYWQPIDDTDDLKEQSLLDHVRSRLPSVESDDEMPCLIVLDQFEELFTSYPEYWEQREGFFAQLNEVLVEFPTTRIVLSIREDYLAHLDPYSKNLADGNWARVRLQPLEQDQAIQAITRPLNGTGRSFGAGVAEHLVEDLAAVQTRDEHGQTNTIVGQFVEPVQLQVVCQNLWDSIDADLNEITEQHLGQFGDVDQALRTFYETSVDRVCSSPDDHALLRNWIETNLITSAGTRGMVMEGADESSEISPDILTELLKTHLIRGEWRHGARWLELTHDRLIGPIQEANREFREQSQEQRVETAEAKAANTERLSNANSHLIGYVIFNLVVAALLQIRTTSDFWYWLFLLPAILAALFVGTTVSMVWEIAIRWVKHISRLQSMLQTLAAMFCTVCMGSLFYSSYPWLVVVASLFMAAVYFGNRNSDDDFLPLVGELQKSATPNNAPPSDDASKSNS